MWTNSDRLLLFFIFVALAPLPLGFWTAYILIGWTLLLLLGVLVAWSRIAMWWDHWLTRGAERRELRRRHQLGY